MVTVDPPDGSPLPAEVDGYLDGLHLDAVPACYRDMVTPGGDGRLLAAYAECLRSDGPPTAHPGPAGEPARLAVHSRTPRARCPVGGAEAERWQHEVYDVAGRFAHLADVSRFVRDIRALL